MCLEQIRSERTSKTFVFLQHNLISSSADSVLELLELLVQTYVLEIGRQNAMVVCALLGTSWISANQDALLDASRTR